MCWWINLWIFTVCSPLKKCQKFIVHCPPSFSGSKYTIIVGAGCGGQQAVVLGEAAWRCGAHCDAGCSGGSPALTIHQANPLYIYTRPSLKHHTLHIANQPAYPTMHTEGTAQAYHPHSQMHKWTLQAKTSNIAHCRLKPYPHYKPVHFILEASDDMMI